MKTIMFQVTQTQLISSGDMLAAFGFMVLIAMFILTIFLVYRAIKEKYPVDRYGQRRLKKANEVLQRKISELNAKNKELSLKDQATEVKT